MLILFVYYFGPFLIPQKGGGGGVVDAGPYNFDIIL